MQLGDNKLSHKTAQTIPLKSYLYVFALDLEPFNLISLQADLGIFELVNACIIPNIHYNPVKLFSITPSAIITRGLSLELMRGFCRKASSSRNLQKQDTNLIKNFA